MSCHLSEAAILICRQRCLWERHYYSCPEKVAATELELMKASSFALQPVCRRHGSSLIFTLGPLRYTRPKVRQRGAEKPIFRSNSRYAGV